MTVVNSKIQKRTYGIWNKRDRIWVGDGQGE